VLFFGGEMPTCIPKGERWRHRTPGRSWETANQQLCSPLLFAGQRADSVAPASTLKSEGGRSCLWVVRLSLVWVVVSTDGRRRPAPHRTHTQFLTHGPV